MEEITKLQLYASMMETILGPGMMESSSPYGMMARQHLRQNFHGGGGDITPQVYDASDRYDSALLQKTFIEAFKQIQEYEKNLDKPMVQTLNTMLPAIEHGVAPLSSLQDLKRVCISDVLKKVNHIHTGCVMLVQVVHVPYRQVGTMVLVRDSNNGYMMLALYNYVAPEENPKDVFPVGKKLAVLCPFLKNAQDNPMLHLMLRCDNPQCVISYDDDKFIWKKTSPLSNSPSPSKLRLVGNQHFQNGNLEQASKCYSQALAHSDIGSEVFASDKVSCLSNRAEVNLRLERWQEAALDALDVLEIQSNHIKAKFRLAKALSRTNMASDAFVLLDQQIKQNDGQSISAMEKLAKECRRIADEERGEYHIPTIMKEASTKQPGERLSSFHATFCSPTIAIGVPIMIPSSGKSYRGCKALSNLKEGELIMSSKAFAVGRRRSKSTLMEVNPYEQSLGDTARMEMVSEVVRKLWKIPHLGKELYSLSDGDPSRPPGNDENLDKIDLGRIRDILRCNSFNQNPYDCGIRQTWEKLPTHDSAMDPHGFERSPIDGLWINESMLNHSCTPSCIWSHVADQIFIHTTKPVQKGDELCIPYYPPDGSYEHRAGTFSRWMKPGVGFECVCDHCDLLRSRDDLRQLANEVQDGIRKVEEVAKSCGTSRAMVAEEIFPFSRRQEILSAFSHLPLRLQHTRIAELHELEACILATNGDLAGALNTNQLAAKINYEVRGSGLWNYFVETWRIAGLAVVCRHFDLAWESLEKIWNSPAFQAFPSEEAEEMFLDLTNRYVTQQIPFDPQYVIQIQEIAYVVLKGIR